MLILSSCEKPITISVSAMYFPRTGMTSLCESVDVACVHPGLDGEGEEAALVLAWMAMQPS